MSMKRDRWNILLENCNKSLLSYLLYASSQYRKGTNEFHDLVNVQIPKIIKERIQEYYTKNYFPDKDTVNKESLYGNDILKAISVCFDIELSSAKRILQGYNCFKDSGLIVRFTNIKDIFLSRENNDKFFDSSSKNILDCYSLDGELISKIYDFILQDQIAILDSIKYMYDNVSFEVESKNFRGIFTEVCFKKLWNEDEFNILDILWKWYTKLVDRSFTEFENKNFEYIFGSPIIQCYNRMLLESNLLHTILVILQAYNNYLNFNNINIKEIESNSSDESSISKISLINKCRIIISKLQSKCFLGSLFTLYSNEGGIKIATLSFCDNALAHSSTLIDQLRQTSTNGILLACSLVLSLSPKSITNENQDLGSIINIVVTILDSLSTNESGEILKNIGDDELSFITPSRCKSLSLELQKQRVIRGNLLLAHAKVVKPILPAFIYSYASIVVQTPNREALISPIINTSSFFESSAFTDSLENILLALNSQNPIKQCISVKLHEEQEVQNDFENKDILLGESFGTYYQHFVVYDLIRNTISTFSLNALSFVGRITKNLSSLLRKEPRLVFRECWRGDYFRQIGVHLILEMYTSFFPYGIVEFLDLLSSLLPDYNLVSNFSKSDYDMSKQAFKLFMAFIKSPIKYINFSPYLNSIGLTPIPINYWNPETIRKSADVFELPLHVEVCKIEMPDLKIGSSFSQSSLSGTLEGCILDFLKIQLNDVTPLSAGFPNARRCLTPLRVLPVGISQTLPLKSLLLENTETTFSFPLWSTSPYGLTYDFPESEMPPYYHIHNSKKIEIEKKNLIDVNLVRLPSNLPKDSSEIKIGNLDPYTIQFKNENSQNSSFNSMPSLLRILLFLWDSIGLSLYQLNNGFTSREQINMLVSLTELIYKLSSFHQSIIFVLEKEISTWNALIPNSHHKSGIPSLNSPQFGIIAIKTLQTLKGIECLLSNKNNDEEIFVSAFYILPRLIQILTSTLQPIDLICIEDALNENFLRLHSNLNLKQEDITSRELKFQFPWKHNKETFPMYWLVPMLLSSIGTSNVDPNIQKEMGPYSSLLKGISGFTVNDFFNLITKTIEIVEKQFKSYPITAQGLQFIQTLLSYCPVSFWGLGWDRHAKLLLNVNSNLIKNSINSKLIKDFQFLLSDCISFQMCSIEESDFSGFFDKISNFTIHSVLSRIPSWQFNVDSERNLLFLRSLTTFGLLLNSMDSITLINDEENNSDYNKEINTNKNSFNNLKDIIPSISNIASSNHHSLIATILKHLIETGLTPTLLNILFCEYSIHSQSLGKSKYLIKAQDELDEIVAPWELLISNSLINQSMIKNESLSYTLAIHFQHSTSQMVFIDRSLMLPFECFYQLSSRSGELFALPDVIVAQQVVTKVLEILLKLFNSTSEVQSNSILLKSLRSTLIQWILTSSNNYQATQISSDILDTPKFTWSDTDLIAQNIHNKLDTIYDSKKPLMNLIKSLLAFIIGFIPSSLPYQASVLATKVFSSFCYILSMETNLNQNSRLDLVLEQILKPPISLNSVKQDFLLCLTNTKLFSKLIKLLHQELDFILIAPVFDFFKTIENGPKLKRSEKFLFKMTKAILELLNLIATSHPSILLYSTGSFDYNNAHDVIENCKKHLIVYSGSVENLDSKQTANSRVKLICLMILQIIEKSNSMLEYSKVNDVIHKKSEYVVSLVPHCINLLIQFLEDSRSRNIVVKEMFNLDKKFNTSLWKVIISITRNITYFWNKFKLKNIETNLYLIILLTSSITCIYHLTSRFINITTYLSFQDLDKLPIFLRDIQIFEFIKFLISDQSIHDILHSNYISNYILNAFTDSNNHFQLIDEKLGIPIKYCVFKDFNLSPKENESSNFSRNLNNSLEQFVNTYYYERYLKLSHLVISNESMHNLTEFDIFKINKIQDKISNDLDSDSFDSNNQSIKTIPLNNSETSQLASLEMVWESGQLLAPKQHLSPKTISYDRKDIIEGIIEDSGKNTNSDSILKHSFINPRINEYNNFQSKILKSPQTPNEYFNSPNLHTIRNSSFIYKTKQWGVEFEIDISALLILLSCSTAAGLLVPHSEMNIEKLLEFSEEVFILTKKDNLSRSFIEAFMYLLTSYNELLFYLKSTLPIIVIKYKKHISKSLIVELATLFDSTKITLISHCINLIQEENYSVQNSEILNRKLFPDLLMTIIFSTCIDLMTYDLFSSVKLILGRVEMIETKNKMKNIKRKTKLDRNTEIFLHVIPICPNSFSVCLSSFWQSSEYSSKIPDFENENVNFGGIIGNLVNFSPVSNYSDKSQINNLRKLFSLIIENCCKYVINNLKNILSNNNSQEIILNANSNQKKYTCRVPNNAFKNLWTIKSFKVLKISKIDYISQEHEVYLSCDIISCIYLLLFLLKQTPNLFDPEEPSSEIKSSTISLLLELTSFSLQFYNKNAKTIQRIASDPKNAENKLKILSFFASTLISIPIICLNIPIYIMEIFYLENKKKLIKDLPSEFTINSETLKVPMINRIKELILKNSVIEDFNLDVLIKILPLLYSIIQLDSFNIDKNESPTLGHQYLQKGENIMNSFDLLKPSKVPFLSWNEAAHYTLLNSIIACLISISSTTQGCISILKSGILIQLVSKIFFLNSWNSFDSYSNTDQNSKSFNNKNDGSNNNNRHQNSAPSTFWFFTYLTIGLNNPTTIRSPMHIIWCKIISLATNIFSSISRLSNKILFEAEIGGSGAKNKLIRSESRYIKYENSSIEKGINLQNLTTVSRKLPRNSLKDEIEKSTIEKKDVFLEDSQIKESVRKFVKLTNIRVQFTLTEARFVSQLAMLEEFNLCIDLIRSILSLEFNDINSGLIEILRKALRTIRNISVVSLGRGITEASDLFKPISALEKISAGHNLETLNIYYLDNLPAQVPSIFHQRCCMLLLNSIRSIIDAFISDSNFSIELFGSRELLMQLFHDTMDLGRPIIQLLEDIPNHCYSVFTIVKNMKGDSFLPLSLNIQAVHPSEPLNNEFISDTKTTLNKNLVEFKGVSKLSATTESCCLPEMITLDSFIQLLSSLIDIIAICGVKCLYTLESLESTEQHNDTLRRFLEFLHLSQSLNSSTLVDSSRKLVEKVYANLKSKLGDQINVEVVGLVGIKKDPIHALLFDRLSNTNNSATTGI